MSIDKRWLLFIAAATGAAASAAFMSRSRQRQRHSAHDLRHKEDVKSWENEGGNVAPIPVVSAPA
jgi:hypothetical protein